METWIACTEAQQKSLESGVLGEGTAWAIIRLAPTREGRKYLKTGGSFGLQYWRAMERIPRAVSHRSLGEIPARPERLRIAEETGRGLGIFHSLTAGMEPQEIL